MEKDMTINNEKLWEDINSNDLKKICKALSNISSIGFRTPNNILTFIPKLRELLFYKNNEVVYKCLWALGQVGNKRPDYVKDIVPYIYEKLNSKDKKVRCNSLWALGRIGRADIDLVEGYIDKIIEYSSDEEAEVRMNFIWACENIATVKPEIFKNYINVFIKLLYDEDIKFVRREAPEIFRVIGKRNPRLVQSAIPRLTELLSDNDEVVQIHSKGALKYIKNY